MDSYRHAEGTATPRDVTRIIGDNPSEANSPSPSLFEGSEPALSPESFKLLLSKLVLHPHDFTLDDVRAAFYHLAAPNGCTPSQIGAFLSALRLTGKDGQPQVVAACARVMQEHALAVDVGQGMVLRTSSDSETSDLEGESKAAGEGATDMIAASGSRSDEGPVRSTTTTTTATGPVCDIVGTGGDGQNTFNVSTTAGIVAAGAGCRVYKHGNKAATSSSGSADILLSMGCPVTSLPPSSIAHCARESPFLFLYAPLFHPAMVHVAPIRKQLGFPTVYNALGPLINPARPSTLICGVHSEYLGPIFAEALRATGVQRAWVVCGKEGLDEISIAGETQVWDLHDGQITERTISPLDFGLPISPLRSVAGGTPSENGATLRRLLAHELPSDSPVLHFVLLNTAALLLVAGKARDGKHGVELAKESIRSGRAREALELFRLSSSKWAVVEE